VGPENGSIPKSVLSEAQSVVMIPGGEFCFNLAVAGTIVMYDRISRA
jgi:tRNA(Leu) C34 or U34 (ribose-2'-O)-methylase TrmL